MRFPVIIPALNEAGELPETLRHARAVPEVGEIFVVDGGSTDVTREIASAAGCRVISSSPGRGRQMRAGAEQADGEVLLFLHADTWLPPEAGRALGQSLGDPRVVGGGFWKTFRQPHWLMRGSRFRCGWRWLVARRIMGDQAMFVRRSALERIGGVPDQPLMEDVELSRRLRRVGRLVLADAVVSTSGRRFREHGVFRTYFRMWQVTVLHAFGKSPEELAWLYARRP